MEKKRKLIFKKDIHTIHFPLRLSFGLIDFNKHARKEIQKVVDSFQPIKNVSWNYTMDWQAQMAQVTAFKTK